MNSCCRPVIVRAASAAASSTAMSSSSLVVGRSATRQRLLNAQSRPRIPSQSIRTKKTSASNSKKAAVSRALRSSSSSTPSASASGQGIFGLEPVNYAAAPVPAVCASPPPPPPKPGLAKYTFPISALLTIGITAYFYVNNQNDSFAYWESMQTGGIPEDDDDDDFEDADEEE